MRKNIAMMMIICVFVIAGCTTGSYRVNSSDYHEDPNMLALAPVQRFEDLPVPSGFALHRQESFIFQNNRIRMGTMSYIGNADFTSIIEFYKRNMAANGWSLLTSVEFNKVIMSFEKDSEGCIVGIEKRGMRKIIISISFSPLSKGEVVVKEKNLDDEY